MLRHLKEITAAPESFNTIGTGFFPEIVGEGEEHRLGANFLDDGLDGFTLSILVSLGLSVVVTAAGPAGLQVDDILAWADFSEDRHLLLDEGTALGGNDIGVKEAVYVGADYVDVLAEALAGFEPLVQGLSGGDWTIVAGTSEGALGVAQEANKGFWSGGILMERLVTDNDQVDHAEIAPIDNVLDLLLGFFNALVGDENTEDHIEAVQLASVTNVLEAVALGAIDTDSLESLALDEEDISSDGKSTLALSTIGEWGVSHTPFLTTTKSWKLWLGLRGHLWRGRWWLGNRRCCRVIGRGRGFCTWGGANVDVVGLNGSHNLGGFRVGSRRVGGRGGVDKDGARGNTGG